MTDTPLTNQQLHEIAARAAHLHEYVAVDVEGAQPDFDKLTGEDVPALLAEVRRLRAAMEEIRHLHKDSPMGPCPVCIDADTAAAGGDGLVPYPCPTGRLAGAQDCDPPHVRAARYAAAGDEMAASLVRDGFGDDEIADMLSEPRTPHCGHEDYHDPHEWADQPGVWCPGHSDAAPAAVVGVSGTTNQ